MFKKKPFQFNVGPVPKGHPLYSYVEYLRPLMVEINKETDRGVALFTASILDQALADILANFMVDSPIVRDLFRYPQPLSGFSARQNLCLALGLISKIEYDQCNTIRKIRNEFAHVAEYAVDFNSEKVAKFCKQFIVHTTQAEWVKGEDNPNRMHFVLTATALHWRWVERAKLALNEKRLLRPEVGMVTG